MPIKAVLFDIDGTLVDSNDQHVLAWQEAFLQAGHTFDRQRIHDQIGKGADMLLPTLLPESDEHQREALEQAHGKIFKEKHLAGVQPFPGAHNLLSRVHAAGKKVVLASSASGSELEHYIGLLKATDLVHASTSADDVESTKPAPDIFATAMKKLAPFTVEEAIVVGDTPYDVEAAAKCGLATVALRSGKFSDDALMEAGAIALYDSVLELLADFDRSPLGAGYTA